MENFNTWFYSSNFLILTKSGHFWLWAIKINSPILVEGLFPLFSGEDVQATDTFMHCGEGIGSDFF